jgi:hypothetical protein
MIGRALAGIAGAVALVVCAPFTFGSVLAAPLGVLAARGLARRKQRPLSRGAAWLGATGAAFIGVLIAFGVLTYTSPPGTLAAVRAAMDSAQAKQEPAELPDWLKRVTPPPSQAQEAVTDQFVRSRSFLVIFGILTAVMTCSILAALGGSIGWVASMLFSYAFTGRWIAAAQPPPVIDLME